MQLEELENCSKTMEDLLSDSFADNGYCVFDDLFDPELLAGWESHALDSFLNVTSLISSTEENFGIGIKNGFKEIVQRHPLRYEMPYGADDERYNIVLRNPALISLVKRILGTDDIIVANRSFVISQPGAEVQGWHSDGPHVSMTEYLPCHVLNVFIPLVKVDLSNGPTEFRPGSHKYSNNLAKGLLLAMAKKRSKPNVAPTLKIGSALLFDYRVLHRGGPNKSSEARPVLVFTFAKSWYRDNLNFPARSIISIMQSRGGNQSAFEESLKEGIVENAVINDTVNT